MADVAYEDSSLRQAAAIAYLFQIDPVLVLDSDLTTFAIRKAAHDYTIERLEEQRKKNNSG